MWIESSYKWIRMECWWAQPSSYDQCAQAFMVTSVRGDEGFVGYTGGDANVKTQLDEIIRNKAICQKAANAVAERGYSRTRKQCRPRSY